MSCRASASFLHDHDRARWRALAGRQRPEARSSVPRQPRKCVWRGGEDPTVPARVADQQDHQLETAIPCLQRETALDCLKVVEDRLGFDTHDPIAGPDQRIPGAAVVRDRDRDLRAPSKAGMEPAPQPIEQADMAGVADRISGGERMEPDVATNDRAQASERSDVDAFRDAVLDPPGRRPRDAARRPDRIVTQAGRTSRSPDLQANATIILVSSLARPRCRTGLDCHRGAVWRTALNRRSSDGRPTGSAVRALSQTTAGGADSFECGPWIVLRGDVCCPAHNKSAARGSRRRRLTRSPRVGRSAGAHAPRDVLPLAPRRIAGVPARSGSAVSGSCARRVKRRPAVRIRPSLALDRPQGRRLLPRPQQSAARGSRRRRLPRSPQDRGRHRVPRRRLTRSPQDRGSRRAPDVV